MNERLRKIHQRGYWRVNIRPQRFEQSRIPSLTTCREVLESSVVLLRGWDYPHLDREETMNGEDWVESGCDCMGHVEYWRLYQSGQFIHYFACREDYELDPSRLPSHLETPSSSGRYLSIIGSLYTVTEIFEFSARLASKGILSPAAEISIRLVGTEGRELFFWERGRYLRGKYICRISEMTFSRTYHEADLLAKASEFALDATQWIFERFNWSPAPRLAEDQERLLQRRL